MSLLPQQTVDVEAFIEIREKSWAELLRRLSNRRLAATIPNSVLVKLFTETARISMDSKEKAPSLSTINVLTVIEGAKGLPRDRQVAVLREGIKLLERTGGSPELLRGVLSEMGEEIEGDAREEVEES